MTTTPPAGSEGSIGYGWEKKPGYYSFWLGTEGKIEGYDRYCIQWLMNSPGAAQVTSVTDLAAATPRISGYEITTPQMAYLLSKYNGSVDPAITSAIAYLVHANFEVDGNKLNAATAVANMESKVKANAPQIAAKALELRAEAIKSAAIGYSNSSVDGGGKREGTISGIYTTYDDGSPAINVPVTVKLNGPAIITESGTNTWSGVTTNDPITLHWKSTGNGKVTYNVSYAGTHKTLSLIDHHGKVQKTITRKIAGPADPEVREGEAFNVIYDFQPLGVSKAVSQEVNTDGTISDVLTTGVDKGYGSGKWLEVGGKPVEVTYKATAYWAGRVKPATADSVPAGAEKLGEVKVKASGEGQKLTAKLKTTKRGYITWVWQVIKAEQGANSDYVHANWKDRFGLDAETSRENFPFRPMGVSNVGKQKVVDGQDLTDTFTASADPRFRDGEWTRLGDGSFDAGEYVPVTYRASVYFHSPSMLPEESKAAPDKAELIKSMTVTASKPGQVLKVNAGAAPKDGFYTWVWEVREADQAKEYVKWIDSGWIDGYGIPEETTSARYEAVIDSALSVRDTKSGTYFVDDVWVKGMPVNHPDFAGGAGFKADVKVIEHSILFFPHGVEVVEENISQAVKIGNTVSIPAKNGFYPSIGDTSWLAKIDKAGKLVPGTYVFVSSFAGDDRVKSLTTSVEDKAEQFTVKPEPSVHTTLMYDNTRGKVPGFGVRKLVDVVTYTNLEVGKPYSVDGELVDKATGKPLLNGEGKPIVSKAEFKAESVNGSVEVVFEVDAGLFAGKTTVAFETLKSDGREIAVHADINDENQTIGFEPGSKLKTTARDVADGDKEIKPEANQTIVDRVCDVNKQLKPGWHMRS
ncbi:VaFE repeat-containing surface-anchored protein [Arcanobacterium hippocoleae]